MPPKWQICRKCGGTGAVKEGAKGWGSRLQLLSPKEADRRLRESGGEDVVQMHCCDGTLEGGAVVRLATLVMMIENGKMSGTEQKEREGRRPACSASACAGCDEFFDGSGCRRGGR